MKRYEVYIMRIGAETEYPQGYDETSRKSAMEFAKQRRLEVDQSIQVRSMDWNNNPMNFEAKDSNHLIIFTRTGLDDLLEQMKINNRKETK